MQTEAPEAFDISREPEAIRSRYGDSDFGRGCLLAGDWWNVASGSCSSISATASHGTTTTTS